MQSKGDISLLVARPPSHFHSSSFNLEEEGFVDEIEDILEYVEDHDEDQDKALGEGWSSFSQFWRWGIDT